MLIEPITLLDQLLQKKVGRSELSFQQLNITSAYQFQPHIPGIHRQFFINPFIAAK